MLYRPFTLPLRFSIALLAKCHDDVFAVIADGCTYSWASFTNTNVNNGAFVNGASTVELCQRACINNASCTGIDFSNSMCWMSGSWSGRRNNGTSIGTTHYDLTRSCAGKIESYRVVIIEPMLYSKRPASQVTATLSATVCSVLMYPIKLPRTVFIFKRLF